MLQFILILLTIHSTQAAQNVFVHLFEWKWSDIARECREFLGPHGYSAVQVSPPAEHAVLKNYPWYQRYQPVSYILNSRSGTETEFRNMIRTCKSAGVEIYVDAVINHMTSTKEQAPILRGSTGSLYGQYTYPGLYEYDDFHHCNRNGDDDIKNWKDRYEIQNCELSNLSDLKTDSPYVQKQIRGYLQKLVSLGVKGFRIDAAKHIPARDLETLLGGLKNRVYVFSEVIASDQEPIKPREYFSMGAVTEFKFGHDMAHIFQKGKLAWVNNNKPLGEDWGYVPDEKAVIFVDNHDTQREEHTLTHKNRDVYLLANIFMLAWPYGYPKVMSSFVFKDRHQSPPTDAEGRTIPVHGGIGCLNKKSPVGWVCEHRWKPIANMVKFRKATSSFKTISNWWTNHNNQIAFSRGNKGFVIINNEDRPLSGSFQTGLAPGRYTDIIQGLLIEVGEGGKAFISLKPRSAAAIHL